MSNNRPSFLLYKSFYAPVKHLKDDELGLLFRALFDYQNGLEIENLAPQVGMAFAFFKNQFDLDDQKYIQTCSENSRNAKLRWDKNKTMRAHATVCERMQTDANDAEKEKGIDKDKEKDINKKPKRFIAPTLEEVKNYCKERNNSVNPEKWISHYQSNGWKVGKNQMKDWKAAVRTWEGNSFGSAKPQSKHGKFEEQDYYANTEGFEVC